MQRGSRSWWLQTVRGLQHISGRIKKSTFGYISIIISTVWHVESPSANQTESLPYRTERSSSMSGLCECWFCSLISGLNNTGKKQKLQISQNNKAKRKSSTEINVSKNQQRHNKLTTTHSVLTVWNLLNGSFHRRSPQKQFCWDGLLLKNLGPVHTDTRVS